MKAAPEAFQRLGEYVRESRCSLGVTQRYLGARAGVSSAHVGRVERGAARPSRSLVNALERALELRVGALFTRLGQPPLDLVGSLLASDSPRPASPAYRRAEWDRYLSDLVGDALRRLRRRHDRSGPSTGDAPPEF